jgi:hypothetical protein
MLKAVRPFAWTFLVISFIVTNAVAQDEPLAPCVASLVAIGPDYAEGAQWEPGSSQLTLRIAVAKSTTCNDGPVDVGLVVRGACHDRVLTYEPRYLRLNPAPGSAASGTIKIMSSDWTNCSFRANLSCPGGGDACLKHPATLDWSESHRFPPPTAEGDTKQP